MDEESIESIKIFFLKEQIYNGFDKDFQRKLLEDEFYKMGMKEVTNHLKNYIQASPRNTGRKENKSFQLSQYL